MCPAPNDDRAAPVDATGFAPNDRSRSATSTIEVGPILTVIATVVLSIAMIVFVRRLVDVIGLVLGAVALALLTAPIRRGLARWLGDSWSIVATAVISLAATVGLAVLVLHDLRAQAEAVSVHIHTRLRGLQPGSTIERIATSMKLEPAIDRWLERIPTSVVVGGEGGTDTATRLLTLLMVVVLAAFLHAASGPIVDWMTAQWPRDGDGESSSRAVIRAFLYDIDRRGVGYVRRSLVLAGAAATVVAGACWVSGMPAYVVAGIWAGAWFVVPSVGWAVGLVPIVALAALDGRPITYVPVVIAALCAVATGQVRRRRIDPATIRPGVGVFVLALAFGVAVAGLGGSLVALVAASVVVAGATSCHQPSRPRPWLLESCDTFTIGRLTLPSGWRGMMVAILATAVGMLAWVLILRVGQSLTWVLVGSFVAIAISRPAAWIERRTPLPRGIACGSLVAALGIVLFAIMVPGLDSGATATSTAADELPGVVAELEQTRFVGGWLRDRGAAVWVEDQMNDLPQRLSNARPAAWLPAISERILDVFWIVLLSVALLIDGPRLIHGTTRRVPARHRRQFTRLVGAVGSALGGYAAGAALVASINGGVVLTIALVLGIGLAPMLAVWAFLWNFVPQIGGFMGGLPLILFALVAGPIQALIAAVAFIAYQFVENHLIQPAVIGAAIDVAPWGTLLAALAGAAAAGVVGAIVLTPLVGVVKVIRAEYRRDDFPGATVTHPQGESVGASEGVAAGRSLNGTPVLTAGVLDRR